MELAPALGLSSRIVDLVSSGRTLKENGLVEVEVIAQVTSRLIVNRAAFKTRAPEVTAMIDSFRRAAGGLPDAACFQRSGLCRCLCDAGFVAARVCDRCRLGRGRSEEHTATP